MKTKSVMEDTEGNAGTTKPNRDATEKRSVSISTVRGNKIDPRAEHMRILKNKNLKDSNVKIVVSNVQGLSH